MRAENTIGLCVGHEFDHSIEFFVGYRAAVGAKRKFADAIIDPLLFRLFLSQTNASQFRIRVNDSGYRIIINMTIFARDALDTGNSFVLGFVRQHWSRDHIANRVNAVDVRLKMFVDLNPPLFVKLNADFFRPETFVERFASN